MHTSRLANVLATVALLVSPASWALAQAGPQPAGESPQPAGPNAPALTTTITSVAGTAMSRHGEGRPWQALAVGQQLPVGAQIRTGVRGAVTMNIGPNAEVSIDRLSEVTLGRLEHDAEANAIRTVLAVTHGKVDFHVKHVGFVNDFRIASPTDVVAVRGTIGTFKAYDGPAEVFGHPANTDAAIAGQAVNTNETFALSRNEAVKDGQRDPDATRRSQQNVGEKIAAASRGAFDVTQQTGPGEPESLRGGDSIENSRDGFFSIASGTPRLWNFCDPNSPQFDAERCRRVMDLLGPRFPNLRRDEINAKLNALN